MIAVTPVEAVIAEEEVTAVADVDVINVMNPRLKFRYYDSALKKMVYSTEWTSLALFFEWANKYATNSDIMQFTGFKDKRGKDIYEYDIIQDIVGEFNTIVFWNDKRGEWTAGAGFMDGTSFIPTVISDHPSCGRSKKIVSNIYEISDLKTFLFSK